MNLDVNLKNLSLKYGDFTALQDISFSLSPQKIYGLIGRNGAGKTSLLALLASFRAPTSGTISIGGEDPFENAKIMRQVSFAYNREYTDDDKPGKAYLEMSQRYRPNFDMDYARELAKRFGLPLDKRVKKLSRGMQSALDATLGLANRAPVSIFDEVYLSMDPPSRKIFYQEIIEDQDRFPRLMILSTHLVSEMEYLFDHVLILDQGRLVIDEDFETVINRGAAVTGPSAEVDAFVKDKKQLSSKQLGPTKSVMIYESISEAQRVEAQKRDLEIGPVSLQELFIHLTEKEDEK